MLAFMQGLSLRFKLILLAMTTTLVALIIVSAVVFTYNNISGYNKLKSSLQVIAKVLADRSVAAIDFGDADLAKQNLSAVDAHKSVYLGCIYDQNDQLFSSYSPASASNKSSLESSQRCPISSTIVDELVDGSLYIVQPVIYDKKKIGGVVIVATLDFLKQQNEALIYTLIVAVLIAAITSFLLASFIERFVSRPIHRLRQTMSDVQLSNDYAIRAVKFTEDEMGDLVDSFNQMLIKIEFDNEALKGSEKKFRTLSSSSPVGIFQTDIDGQIIYANERWCQITGLENLMEVNQWGDNLHPDDRSHVLSSWSSALLAGDDFKMEYRFLIMDEQEVTVVSQAKALYNTQQDIIGYLGSMLDISDLKAAQIQLEHLALYDPLTRIANRFLLKNRLEKAIKAAKRNKTTLGLMFLDIDDFKRINDSMGHDAGDELLKVIADRIKSCVRQIDTVARFGGDEFVVLLTDTGNHLTTDLIAQALLKEIKKPIRINQQNIIVTASIGVTMALEDGDSISVLMKNADLAMYRAKSEGKDTYQYFSQELNHEILRHLTLEIELRAALENDEFFLVYQPKFDIKRGQVTGFESLIRWRSSTRGLISPKDIIPVAEDTGIIIPIGEWVLRSACRDVERLIESGVLPREGRIAVNLSAKQFKTPCLIDKLIDIVRLSNINPKNLEFEITETILMEDITNAIQLLNRLKRLGSTIAIDDFGTGYSSLSYLKQLPIDYLKVDRSFVDGLPDDVNDVEITSAIIAMSHKLGLKVVAEGVETPEQLKFLNENECDLAQGYYFGEGVTIEELMAFPELRYKKFNRLQKSV